MTQRTEIEQTETEETTTAIVPFEEDSTSIEIIPGMNIMSNMTFRERLELAKRATGIVARPSENVAEYLNTPIPCTGVIMHPCRVRSKKERIDRETGEAYYPLVSATRTVFLRADSDKALSFVASSITEFVSLFVLPIFGNGIDIPWEQPITFVFRQVATSSGGRAYSTKIVDTESAWS